MFWYLFDYLYACKLREELRFDAALRLNPPGGPQPSLPRHHPRGLRIAVEAGRGHPKEARNS